MNRFKSSIARLSYSSVFWPVIWFTGNRVSQKFLALVLNGCQHLMGIGTGSDVNSSGERILPKLIRKKSDPPYVIFDVGANIGDFTRLVARSFCDSDRIIHAFEPASSTYSALKENLQGNKGIILNNCGLADTQSEAILYYDDQASGIASLTKRHTIGTKPFEQTEKIELTTLDNYCGQHQIEMIDLLKMDVEGHEFDILNGGLKLFAKNAIKMVSFEFSGANVDTRTYFFDFFSFFKTHQMKLFRLTRSGYLHPIKEYTEDLEQFRTTIFLAVLVPDESPNSNR